MYLIVTRSFPPELGGMQSLMWGLSRELSKNFMIKVFADYIEDHKEFDEQASFSIERVGGIKLLRKYRKAQLINEYIKENKILSLNDIKGENGTLIMFICNHCPYVKAITKELVQDCNELKKIGINTVAICSNDFVKYPDDSFDNMIKFSNENNFNFPYLHDETQEIAKAYDAVCTPDFFGYNKNLELQYRGRLRELKNFVPVKDGESDLLMAMKQVAETQKGPEDQIPSAGCGIKWKYD